MSGWLRALGGGMVRTRADRVGLVVLVAIVGLFAVLALAGRPVGGFALSFVAGGAVAWTLLVATDRSERWRRPAAVAAVLLLLVWLASGVLSLWAPALEVVGPSLDLEAGTGAFARGLVSVGAILGLMKLFGPEGRRDGR